MLEGLVAWVLNNYLGKYVENLNTDQLSVALLSGKVELENLPLKKDALRHLGLPVEIKAGFIGKVQLHVPVRQIRSAPWLIAIEKLYLVAAPVNLDEWDSRVEASYAHERKVAILDALEAQWRAEHEASDAGYYAASYSSWLSYGTGLLANIVENLQLKLTDVHIRYEDALTCAPHAFACGLAVESLAAESCDSGWRRGFTPLTEPCSFKLLELHHLAVYWDPMLVPAGMMADCTVAELTERMGATWESAHRFVLSPTGASARVRRERCEQPLRDRARPRLACHLTLSAVSLKLTQRQYSEMAGCSRGLERVARLRDVRALRPDAPLRGHARAWWRYALRAHAPHHRWLDPKPTWESCLEQARKTLQYVEICLTILSNPAGTLPPDKKAVKDEYEWAMPLNVLKPLREIAMRKVPVSTPASTPEQASSGRSVLVRWFPQWWGWYAPAATPTATPAVTPTQAPTPTPTPVTTTAPRLEDEILDVIADSLDDNTLLRRDAVFGLFEFNLEKGSLDLCTESVEETYLANGEVSDSGDPRGEGVELQFSRVCVRVESRPRAGAHSLQVSLGALCLRERVTPHSLFPVLVAPQGMIREGLSATQAAGAGAGAAGAWWRAAGAHAGPPADPPAAEPLFQLSYDKRPAGLPCDYRLRVKSRSIEVVWSVAAARWATRFLRAAGGARAERALASVRDHTRARLLTHWGRLVHDHQRRRPGPRGSWMVELDISAPQILLVEQLCSRDAPVMVLDFGRLRLANAHLPERRDAAKPPHEEEDDGETFMTPCSTPPGSPQSPRAPPPPPLDADHLQSSLYDRYKIELSDLQILVGRARDNWKYAHTKSTSALHLLDRFSISLQAERRVVATSDPQWPRAALCGSLPALVVHLSEGKLAAVRAVLAAAAATPDPHTPKEPPNGEGLTEEEEEDSSESSETERSEQSAHQNATLFMLQFAIDQMSLEVQSRGRSIAEVQVCGVRAALSARPADAALSLSVHSLLLVDALQAYGPDFELLVASHKHVGMDTASGSIRGSEPTSPTSPASPAGAAPPPTPHALHRALHSLHHAHNPDPERTSPGPWMGSSFSTSSNTYGTADSVWGSASAWDYAPAWEQSSTAWSADANVWGSTNGWAAPGLVDSEALIAIELCFVKGDGDSEDLRIANILFNNLDVIANQETIVELIGFAHRVVGAGKKAGAEPPPPVVSPPAVSPATSPATSPVMSPVAPPEERKRGARTEVTFDFHRLGVLLVRAALRHGAPAASKVATATLGEARIQATLDGPRIEVSGSLGGVQVVALCEGAGLHARILCAGRAPAPHHDHHDHPHHAAHHDHLAPDDKALLFSISRTVQPSDGDEPPVVEVKVNVHVASVWYTHSGPLLRELRSCLAQFQEYLANLARSIRAAAADMAIGLVHPRGETLYSNPRLSQSVEGVSPRRRTMSAGASLDDPSEREHEREHQNIILSVCVELESPVAVVARAAHSAAVFVAHLGRMSLANRPAPPARALYSVRVRDISLVSLEVDEKQLRAQLAGGAASMADMYDAARGRPVLHDTELSLTVAYDQLCDGPQCSISGKVVGDLHVTASREQYEQLLDTLRWVGGSSHDATDSASTSNVSMHSEGGGRAGGGAPLVEPAVPTLRLDPALRAAVLAVPPPRDAARAPPRAAHTPLTVAFELPTFTVELRADLGGGERSLVALTFREFSLKHEHLHPHETTLQVSLHSITMEDLTKEPDSKHRMLMVSHTPPMPPKAVYVSKSCPDFITEFPDDVSVASSLQYMKHNSISLPSELNIVEGITDREHRGRSRRAGRPGRDKRESVCGATPPCSPEQRALDDASDASAGERADCAGNLVWLSVHERHRTHPRFHDLYNKVGKLTKVEFNCLKLVLSIDSWVAVLDFFGVAGDEPSSTPPSTEPHHPANPEAESSVSEGGVASETEMSVRSLSVVVVGARGDACRALVSRARVHVRGHAGGGRSVHARLGALALSDLAPRAPLWRDRLRTRTTHALTIQYNRLSPSEAAAAGHETSLSVEMGPVTYVHTRRFILELQAFARDFSLLRRVIMQARRKVSSAVIDSSRAQRMRLSARCAAPLIVVPVSGRSRAALAVELTELHLDNCFKRAGDPDTVSTLLDPDNPCRSVLDVRSVRLEGVSLWCARGGRGLAVRRAGPPLLPAPARLTLALESRIGDAHDVADMTLQGALSTLQLSLDAAQYALVRGVLAHNLAEPCADLLPPPPPAAPAVPANRVWPTWSMKLDLQDVALRLRGARARPPLACINFIKSRLLVENYSDLSQDIDLVSQEILVSDTRYNDEPANRRGNVFSHIVQPLPDHRHSVQAEVHARKRQDSSAYTILVNNMRLMAILDWWEAANQFIMQSPPPAADPDQLHLDDLLLDGVVGETTKPVSDVTQMELKLNITDSQLVLVEDASVWDTNAVILKSTTVITYRTGGGAECGAGAGGGGGGGGEPALVCEVSELEVFSCVLGLEEETALSILDPAALTAALHRDRLLHITMGTLNLRLSYHDMRMFASMLQSLPEQARVALSGKSESQANTVDAPANKLHMGALGGVSPRAQFAAPRWARAARHAPPAAPPPAPRAPPSAIWPLRAIQVDAECVTLCVIDDCLDSDVPLLEVSLAELQVEQDLRKVEESFEDPLLVATPSSPAGGGTAGSAAEGAARAGAGGGRLRAQLAADYYNRLLSGWEPVLEPWRFEAGWEYTLSSALSLRRVQVDVTSADTLNTNVTSALVDLCRLVRANWAADYYAPQSVSTEQSPKGSPAGHRRRSPFVPYALRNLTGHRLWFTTILTTSDELRESGEAQDSSGPDDSWMCVRAGDTEPFSFGARRGRARGGGAAAGGAALHRVALRLDGWAPPDPICVDRVGVFFRHLTHIQSGLEARIVLEVSLEGSARKLVTVRSALQLVNKLPHPVEVRVDYAPSAGVEAVASGGAAGRAAAVRARAAALQRRRLQPLHPLHPIFYNCAAWSSVGGVGGGAARGAQVAAGAAWAAPLAARAPAVWTRPLLRAPPPAPPLAPAAIDWRDAGPAGRALAHYECAAPHGQIYRFCCVIVRERFPPERGEPIAGHTLTLVPALRLENLLPLEMQYRAGSVTGTLAPGDTKPFHEVNVEEGVEISVKLEGFGWSTALSVSAGAAGGGGGAASSFSARLKLRDQRSRRLYLNARVTIKKTDGVKVSISAAYWVVNRTGLPLVFRAEGGGEAAGQAAEHELARMVAPLPFSFADADTPTLAARLATQIAPNPEWCSPFGLGPGVTVKKLEGGERVFAVGVSVRAGRGRHRRTNVVTLAPRYQLHNNTPRALQFAQKCTATTLNDPGAIATHVTAVAGCYLPWHWPRWEREQLLCVRVLAPRSSLNNETSTANNGGTESLVPITAWSGGFRIETARSLHVACRETTGSGGSGGGYVVLRAELLAEGATLLLVLTDADSAPPPIRIDNHSRVAIMFHQVGCSEECVVGAGGRVRWALPEPEGAAALALRAPGGPRLLLPLDAPPAAPHAAHALLYQNFVYVAFTATAAAPLGTAVQRENSESENVSAESDNVLVLEVPLGSTRVVLARKRYGDRSQLWRRGPNDQLIHEGSSPPQPTDAMLSEESALSPHAMVLDIEEAAPRPARARAAALALRRADGRRASTQAWRLVGGRMACAHANLCVQPDGGLMGLAPGNRVVLGMASGGRAGGRGGVPPEQAVAWRTLRPGSGRLAVTLAADGPTRLVRIHDRNDPEARLMKLEEDDEESEMERLSRGEWGVRVQLAALSVSLVARSPPAELVFAQFMGVRLDVTQAPNTAHFTLIVDDMQWDNQLLGTSSPVLLHCLAARAPALHAAAELAHAPARRYNALFFNHFVVALRPIAVRLEERLILLLWAWALAEREREADEAAEDEAGAAPAPAPAAATRYYFALLKIIPSQIRLSMQTASKLEGGLGALKRRLGLTLIRFEDAAVELEPFQRAHAFDTPAALARQMLHHFKDELKWQAAKILGSVDFLGNPLGFVADVSEGVSGLLLEGNVAALLKNVTHGISNSAAKVTESLGDGLERVVGDEAHEETRRRIRSAAAGAHLAAGLRGLGLGLLGGVTSLVKHSYEGATSEGLPGFIAGVGKGIVGTVTKPVIGVLDLAAETAAALRESSRRAGAGPARARPPRLAAAAALLPRYCAAHAQGAALLHALNGHDYSERFLAYRIVRDTPHDIRALLSDEYLRIFTCKNTTPQIVMETHLSNLVSCTALSAEGAHFVELGVRGAAGEGVRRPRVQCDAAPLAAWLARHAALARQLHHDRAHTLAPHTDL